MASIQQDSRSVVYQFSHLLVGITNVLHAAIPFLNIIFFRYVGGSCHGCRGDGLHGLLVVLVVLFVVVVETPIALVLTFSSHPKRPSSCFCQDPDGTCGRDPKAQRTFGYTGARESLRSR